MRTIEIDVFTYAELEGKAKERARDWYLTGQDYPWWHESLEAIEGFCDLFNVKVKKYSVGAFENSWLTTSASNENFRGWGKAQINALKDKSITGYYIDCILTDALIEMYALNGDAKNSFEYAIEKAVRAIRDDMEYQYSEEAVIDSMEANHYEFDQHGKRI
jgi:hypothetical protein